MCSLGVCKTAYLFTQNECRITTVTIGKYQLFPHIELKKAGNFFENLTLDFFCELINGYFDCKI